MSRGKLKFYILFSPQILSILSNSSQSFFSLRLESSSGRQRLGEAYQRHIRFHKYIPYRAPGVGIEVCVLPRMGSCDSVFDPT